MGKESSKALPTDRLWTCRDLAHYLNYQEATVQKLSSTAPERLPPRVAKLGRPRWHPEIVYKWVIENSNLSRQRLGRPRQVRQFQ